MDKSLWIELLPNARTLNTFPEVEALKTTFKAAEKIAGELECSSKLLRGIQSADIEACAAVARQALRTPENEQTAAIKAAGEIILRRQVTFSSALIQYEQRRDAWQNIRHTLVSFLEALVVPARGPELCNASLELSINCVAVADLIDRFDVIVNEANARLYRQMSDRSSQAGFERVFDMLNSEVSDPRWVYDVRRAYAEASCSTSILRDMPIEKIFSTNVPSDFVKCCALDAALADFERALHWDLYRKCRQLEEDARYLINDKKPARLLLAAMPDVAAMMTIEQRRDSDLLRAFAPRWLETTALVDAANLLFGNVTKLLPEAIAEAASITNEKARLQAQNLCLFAASRLKNSLNNIRESNLLVHGLHPTFSDIKAAINRGHQSMVKRVKSKQLQQPTTHCQ